MPITIPLDPNETEALAVASKEVSLYSEEVLEASKVLKMNPEEIVEAAIEEEMTPINRKISQRLKANCL